MVLPKSSHGAPGALRATYATPPGHQKNKKKILGPWGGHGAPWGPMGGPGGLMAAVSLNDGAANKLPWGPGGPESDLCHPPRGTKKKKKNSWALGGAMGPHGAPWGALGGLWRLLR